MGPAIVTATVDIYQAIKKELLPTPAKSHYTYNMRDLSKVFQGISMVGVPVDTPEKMARWVLLEPSHLTSKCFLLTFYRPTQYVNIEPAKLCKPS